MNDSSDVNNVDAYKGANRSPLHKRKGDYEQAEEGKNDEDFGSSAQSKKTKKKVAEIAENHSFSDQDVIFESYKFKAGYFAKFFMLCIVRVILGPLTLLFMRNKQEWKILAYNLNLFGGWRELIYVILWLMRIYVITITLAHSPYGLYANLYINLYLLIFTEISLAVLYAAYYSSFRKSDIDRIMSDRSFKDSNKDIGTKLYDIKKTNVDLLLDRRQVALDLPEIDFSMFYFTVPDISKNSIPESVELKKDHANPELFENFQDLIVIDGLSVCRGMLDASEIDPQIKNSEFRVGKIISRFIVLLRILYPILEQLYSLFKDAEGDYSAHLTVDNLLIAIAYLSFAILLFRFYVIYDALFLGLVLYFEKLRLMLHLSNMITDRQIKTLKTPLKISLFIPQNIINWINTRRILSAAHQQVYTVVDVNLSFTLIYLVIYIAFIIGSSLNVTKTPEFLKDTAFQVVTATYLLVMIVILIVGLTVGVLINFFFHTHRKILLEKLDILQNLKHYSHFYFEQFSSIEERIMENPYDRYFRELVELKEILKPDDFRKRFEEVMDQNIRVLTHAVKELKWDEELRPHTILGLTTNLGTLATVVSGLSVLGISNVKLIFASLS